MRLKAISKQTIVITGASSGIGLATARELSTAGARLVVAARNEAALNKLVEAITAQGGEAAYVVADVGREEDVRRIAETALNRFGGFDTWFNNAGTTILGKTEGISLANHRRLFETNYWGVVHGSLVAPMTSKRKAAPPTVRAAAADAWLRNWTDRRGCASRPRRVDLHV